MKKRLFFTIISLTTLLIFSCTPKETFTNQEKELIFSHYEDDILPLYTKDNPQEEKLLRQIAKELTPGDIRSETYLKLKERMLATVNDTTNAGVGIAAPQIGISRKLIAVQRFDKAGEPFEFYPNCEIAEYSEEKKWGWEGCLSIPEIRDTVNRSTQIVIEYTDEQTLKPIRDTVKGYTAVIFQHEIDHLNGTLFTDYKTK